MKEVLNGSNPSADARLIADIDAADPYDGGCAADCQPTRKPVTTQDISEASIELGIQMCITRLCQMGMRPAADALRDQFRMQLKSRGEVLK